MSDDAVDSMSRAIEVLVERCAPLLRADWAPRRASRGKPDEAIAELKQGGLNPYAQLGLIEAYTQLGRKRDADADAPASR